MVERSDEMGEGATLASLPYSDDVRCATYYYGEVFTRRNDSTNSLNSMYPLLSMSTARAILYAASSSTMSAPTNRLSVCSERETVWGVFEKGWDG